MSHLEAMTGAESLMRTLAIGGVEVCFANPGTTEMPLVAALDATTGVRAVLGLFEGVCTGAADGYGRMRGKPALTLLHLGPGFANGIANLHNARRAHSPVLNLVGDQATWHLAADAPLTSDIASLARPVSGFVASASCADELPRLGAEALGACLKTPGQVATLIVPADCQWNPAGGPVSFVPPPPAPALGDSELQAAAGALAHGADCVLMLGGAATGERGLRAAARIGATTGCRVFLETFVARLERGTHLPELPRLPYFPEQALEALAGASHFVCAGTAAPVSFFGYPGVPSRLTSEGSEVIEWPLACDLPGSLEALAERVGSAAAAAIAPRERPARPTGHELTPAIVGQALAALQPENAIVVDEAATSGLPYAGFAPAAPPHTTLSLTGGAIGQGLPCATGAAVACPDRRVIAFQADGSGMYTLQALWTQARESLDVVTLVCANRSYRILQVELARAGIAEPGPKARALTDLGSPHLDWVALAGGMGVPASRATSADDLVSALARAFATPGPTLIEAVL